MKLISVFALSSLFLPSFAFADCPLGDQAMEREAYQKASNYYLLCSQNGDIEAEYKLATLSYYGKGLPEPNKNKAMKFYGLAANKGYLPAQVMYGVLNYSGTDKEPSDKIEAYKWLLLSLEKTENRWFITAPKTKDNKAANLAVKYFKEIEKHLNEEEKKEARVRAGQWKEQVILRLAEENLSPNDYAKFIVSYNASNSSRAQALNDLKAKINKGTPQK